MSCFPLAILLASLLSTYGEVVVHVAMFEATPVLTTRSTSGAWTRIAVFGPQGCILAGATDEPEPVPKKDDGA